MNSRPKTGILAYEGFSIFPKRPENEELSFAPRVHIPILMINGKYDMVFLPPSQVTKEILGWLDRYQDPVL